MNRGQLLAMLSSAGALAGCAGTGMTGAVNPGRQTSGIRNITIQATRRSAHFPAGRPDGVRVASRARYAAAVREAAKLPGLAPQVITPICTQDSCGGDGGGGDYGGPQPDFQFNSGPQTGYYWDSSNYVETWTSDGNTLISQATWTYDSSANTMGLTFDNDNGSVTATGPAWYDDGTYSINNGAATLVVSTANGMVHLTHQSGISFSAVTDGTNMTFTSSQNGYSLSSSFPVTDVAAYASIGRQAQSVRHTDANFHCVAIALIGIAMMLAIFVVALALVMAACAATTPAGCAAAGLLIAAMTERALNGVKNWVRSQGCG